PSAYHPVTAMSEKLLAFSTEPLAHRVLVIYESAALQHSEFASYLLRSFLSEGQIRYEFVEKTSEGLQARTIEREGPVALLVTTPAPSLHAENETRLLSIPVKDTRDQTRAILRQIARRASLPPVARLAGMVSRQRPEDRHPIRGNACGEGFRSRGQAAS